MPNTNEQLSREQQIAALEKDWATNPRWKVLLMRRTIVGTES